MITERVAPEDALERVRGALGDKARDARINFGQVDLACSPGDLVEVATALRDAPDLECSFFTFLSGIDWSEFGGDAGHGKPTDLEVLVHVYSPDRGIHVNVHVPIDPAQSACPSITSVYRGAAWHERECAEMFGIDFPGHPHLVKLYLTEDFEGHPLRRSFKLPSRALVKDWPGAKDPEEAASGGRG